MSRDEICSAGGGFQVTWFVQRLSTINKGTDHQTVPARDELGVGDWRRAVCTGNSHLFEERFETGEVCRAIRRDVCDRSARDSRCFVQAQRISDGSCISAKGRIELVIGPSVVNTFFGFSAGCLCAIGILGGKERALWCRHIANDVIEGTTRGAFESRVFGQSVCLQEVAGQQRLII